MGGAHGEPGEAAVREAERTARAELGAVPRLIKPIAAQTGAERLEQVIGGAEKTAKYELAPVGGRINAMLAMRQNAADSDATAVRTWVEDRVVVEMHALPPGLEHAEAKVELALRCRKEMLELASRPELVERYFPGKRPEKLSEAQKEGLTGRVLLDMGYTPADVRSWVVYRGLAYSTMETDRWIAGARQLIAEGKKESDPGRKTAMAMRANALASGALMDFGKYIVWECGFRGYNLKDARGLEAFRRAREGFRQLVDAESYVAYSGMLALNTLVDENGRYIAKPNRALRRAYLDLVQSGPDVLPSAYGRKMREFHSLYANVASDEMEKYGRMREIGRAKGVQKAYIVVEPYVNAAVPVVVAAAMIIDPAAVPLGSVYFGNEAMACFRKQDYLTGTLMSLALIAPFLGPLRASPALRDIAAAGRTLSTTAGIMLQVDMANATINIISNGVRQGEFTTSDMASLITNLGFALMPAAGMKAGRTGGIRPKEAPLERHLSPEQFRSLLGKLKVGEMEGTMLKNLEAIEAGEKNPKARDLLERAPEYAPVWYDLFVREASELGLDRKKAAEYAKAFLSFVDLSEKAPYSAWGHNLRVAQYMELLFDRLGVPRSDRPKMIIGALIHDIGKMGVERDILRKDGRPTPEEWERVVEHSATSGRICIALGRHLGGMPRETISEIATIAASHHENFDGSGTFGLGGQGIPLGGRLLRILDSFDTMLSKRMYKEPRELADALKDLNTAREGIYDREILDALTATITGNPAAFERVMQGGK